MKRLFRRGLPVLLLLCLFCSSPSAQELQPVPPLEHRVTDLTGMLTPEERDALETALRRYEEARGSQIVILLVSSTAPETIEQYSIRVADAWKPGRKGIDDGVLLLVAKDNPPGLNRLRIETGRGTEGVLTDIRSRHILENIIAPRFRKNDFYGGLSQGASAIMAALDQEGFAAPENRERPKESAIAGWLPLLFMLVFFFLIIRARKNRALMNGIILGGTSGRRSRHDDFDGGGSGGGFGGGSGGGGFSGGGGGFSGGGASGNW